MWAGGGWEKRLVPPEGFVSLTASWEKGFWTNDRWSIHESVHGTLHLLVYFFLAWAREWLSVPCDNQRFTFPWHASREDAIYLFFSEVWTWACRSASRLSCCPGHWLTRTLFLYYTRLLTQDVSIPVPIGEPECSKYSKTLYAPGTVSIGSLSVSRSSLKH